MRHAGVTPAGMEAAGCAAGAGGADSADRPREECGVFGACMNPGATLY